MGRFQFPTYIGSIVTPNDLIGNADILKITNRLTAPSNTAKRHIQAPLQNENDGYTYLLVAVDVFTKYVCVEPLREKSAQTVATALEKIVKHSNGRLPVYLQTDKGKEFVGTAIHNVLKNHRIRFRSKKSRRESSCR